MKKILLPTDFSENSLNAIKYALEFFKDVKVTFYLMHAYEDEFYDHEELITRDAFDAILENIKNKSQANMSNLLRTVKEIAPNPKFIYHTISSYNTLVEEANKITEAKNIDLIVMGTKGKSDERHIVFGSHTFQVLKYVQSPVLAIPTNYTNTKPKHILFSTNYNIAYKRRELKLISDIATLYRSTIDILNVSQSTKLSIRQEDNKNFIKEVLRDNDVSFHHIKSKKVSEHIETFIRDKNIDIVTMVNTQHSFLEDMLFPSTIDKISLGLKIPLLAMQNTARF